MDKASEDFLHILRCYVNNEKLPDDFVFDSDGVFSLAAIHNVIPFVYSVTNFPIMKTNTIAAVGMQIQKNVNFNILYNELKNGGFDVLIVKGPVCASLYPDSDMRLSSDFDIIVKEEQYAKVCDYLQKNGFSGENGVYKSESRGLYIEVSTCLGEGSDRLKAEVDKIFDGFWNRAIINGDYLTLSYTEHMLYLIYHAFKHFIGSGFGIRQLIDIMLFSDKYKDHIDFDFVRDSLEKINADGFYNNVFYVIHKIFGREPAPYNQDHLCFDEFINDLMSAGIFGKSSEDRLHSASVVISAVEHDGKRHLRESVFPSYKQLAKKYKILNILPFLLPLFWIYRIVSYGIRCIFGKNTLSPTKSIELADSRIKMMKKMGIVKQ